MDKFFIKPASEKVKVRDPGTGKPLAKDGETKPRSIYWLRRLKDKDVVEATPAAAEPAPIPGKGK